MKRSLLLALALSVATGVLGFAYSVSNGRTRAPSVRIVNVDSGPVLSSIRATGVATSTRSVRVASTIGGQLGAVHVSIGGKVAKGSPLVSIDAAEATLQSAADIVEVSSAETEITQHERALAVLREDQRIGAESRERVVQAEERLALAQVRLRKAAAKLELSKLRVAQSVITAPFTGTVTDVNVHPGEVVAAGTPLVTVAGDAMEILARLEQGDAQQVRPGMVARVSLDGAPEKAVDEKVLRIEPAVRKEGNTDFLAVWISLTPSSLELRPNQQVDVRLQSEARQAPIRLPLEALVTTNGKAAVWVVESGRLHALPITIGIIGDRHVEVLAGLRSGQAAVVLEGRTLKEGDAVAVARPDGP